MVGTSINIFVKTGKKKEDELAVMHYGRILYALEQTERIMREIDKG